MTGQGRNVQAFVHEQAASRVVFGIGTLAQLPVEAERLALSRILLLCAPEQRPLAERGAALLGSRAVGICDGAVPHVPVESVRTARELAQGLGADGVLAIGGGSTTGLAKALALHTGLPIVAVPTTYAGSEMTPIYGLTDSGLKTTGRDPRVLPRTVIYDPTLSSALPLAVSIDSGLNAIAHAAEALYAHDGSPIHALMAEEGLRAMAAALPRLAANPQDLSSRSDALYAAWLCGSVLGAVSMGLHHKLCHTLGGTFNLPHAPTHAALLPHALAYNAKAAPKAMVAIARALGAAGRSAPAAMFDLGRALGGPAGLREIGLRESELDQACELALSRPYPNPRPLERAAMRALLEQAFHGIRPE